MTAPLLQSPLAVAVSGGADSLYALIRLRESARSVFALHGIFMRPGAPWGAAESAAGGRDDDSGAKAAEAVRRRLALFCNDLGIPLHIVDLSADFLRAVVRPFVQGYADGLTPNPCALCNARLKFGLLLDKARSLGASRMATGHYARLRKDPEQEHGPLLLQGRDPLKDQSYFLSLVPRKQLAAGLFPLGDTHKREVLAALGRRNMLPPLPGESQEICFVPNDDYRAFLPGAARRLDIALPGPGPMLLADGSRLGEHRGLWQYTEGQRRGLGLGWKKPLYVIAKCRKDNMLLLGPREEMRASGCLCEDVNILLPPSFWPETVLVKTRYRERPKAARASLHEPAGPGGPSLRIRFLEPDTSIAPGQIAAVYIPFCQTPSGQNASEKDAQTPPGREHEGLRLVAGGVITGIS